MKFGERSLEFQSFTVRSCYKKNAHDTAEFHENTVHKTYNFKSRIRNWNISQDYLTAGFLVMFIGAVHRLATDGST